MMRRRTGHRCCASPRPQPSWSGRSAWRRHDPARQRRCRRKRTGCGRPVRVADRHHRPAATEAPATTAAAGTAAGRDGGADHRAGPRGHRGRRPTEARETVPPVVTELDSTTAIDINAQPRDALQQGGELRLAVGRFADNWNPYNPLGNDTTTPSPQPMCVPRRGTSPPTARPPSTPTTCSSRARATARRASRSR